MDITSIIDRYKSCSFDEKREKLVGLLEVFVQYRPEINDVIMFIQQGKISEQDMIDTYVSFITSINDIKKESLEKSLDKITILHQNTLAIHKAEEADKAKEGNLEDVLKRI